MNIRSIIRELPLDVPSFDWKSLSEALGLQISVAEASTKKGSEIKRGLGSHLETTVVTVAPLGNVLWMMSHDDIGKVVSWIVAPDAKTRQISSEDLIEGFYRYMLLETMSRLELPGISLQISQDALGVDEAYCVDVEIRADERRTAWGRLVVPLDVKGAFERHMAREPRDVPESMKESVLVDLKIEVGAVVLTAKELKKIKKGDFIVLDRKTHLLTLRGKPIYNVHIADDQIRLAEVATTYEESMTELKELEMTVTVELAKLTMSLGELMKLSAGTTLDVPVSPENTVTLSVNGQAVGKAELVSLGDTQGLRILEIG